MENKLSKKQITASSCVVRQANKKYGGHLGKPTIKEHSSLMGPDIQKDNKQQQKNKQIP